MIVLIMILTEADDGVAMMIMTGKVLESIEPNPSPIAFFLD